MQLDVFVKFWVYALEAVRRGMLLDSCRNRLTAVPNLPSVVWAEAGGSFLVMLAAASITSFKP